MNKRLEENFMIKRLLAGLFCLVMIASQLISDVYANPSWPSDVDIQAEAGIVIDADSGAILWGKDIDTAYPPASITKLLTAMVVLEHSDMEEIVTVSERAVNNVESDSGNPFHVAAGDKFSVEDCLYLLLVRSCNQIGNALAEHVAGTQEAFVEMMNQKIKELGCTNSNFNNASGLNGDTQYVTARDMAIIAKAAFAYPELVEISGALSHTLPPMINNPDGLTISAEHRLIYTSDPNDQFYYPPAIGGKTGYLLKAGNTLVTYAEQDGKRLISVILRGKRPQYFLDGKALLEFGFAGFDNYNIAEQETAYTTGDNPITINVTDFSPSDLEIDPAGTITVPKGAAFSDCTSHLAGELPPGAPERSVAYIEYTYENRTVGGAFLKEKAAIAPEIESPAPTTPDSENKSEPPATPKKEKLNPLLFVLPVFILGIIGGIAYLFISHKKEQEQLARRREQRRRRLREEGVTAEEFDSYLRKIRKEDRGKK